MIGGVRWRGPALFGGRSPFPGVLELKEKGIWGQESWISELAPAFARSLALEPVKFTEF